jgi:hypothetical protein
MGINGAVTERPGWLVGRLFADGSCFRVNDGKAGTRHVPDGSALHGERGVLCSAERRQLMPEQTITHPIARRDFLRHMLSGAVAGAAVAGIEGVRLDPSWLKQP